MDFYFQKLLKFPRKVQTIYAPCSNTWEKVTHIIVEFKKLSSYQQSAIISSIVNFAFVYTQS